MNDFKHSSVNCLLVMERFACCWRNLFVTESPKANLSWLRDQMKTDSDNPYEEGFWDKEHYLSSG